MRILWIFLLFGCGLATADTFLIKSTDGGRTWVDIDPGPPYQLLASFNVDPRTSVLYAVAQRDLGAEGRLLVSTDGGQMWQARQSFPPAASWRIVAAGPVNPDTLYLAYEEAYEDPSAGFPYPRSAIITKLTDGGQTMEQYRAEGLAIVQGTVPNSFGGYLTGLAVDPAAPSRLYAVITNELNDDLFAFFQALWVSTDGGRHWRRLEPPVTPNCTYPGIWIDHSDSAVYLACGRSEFLKSTDGGESWTQRQAPAAEQRIWNLQIGPSAPAILYTTGIDQAIWRSTDGAETWQRSGDLPPGVNRSSLRVHPTNPSVVFGSGANGIWKSENGGGTWTKLAEYGANFEILTDPHAPDTLYGYSQQRRELRLNDRQTFLRNLVGEKQVAPGSLVSIYGRDLARETRAAGSTPLPASLAGASVSFDGRPASLLFVSPEQINAQVPFGLSAETVIRFYPPTTSVIMEVRRPDASVDRQTVSLSPRAVFVLREDPIRQSAPLLFHASDFRRVSVDAPIRRGEAITLFALGMGELKPSLSAGELPPTPLPQLANPTCAIWRFPNNGWAVQPAPPLWAGAAPGLIGLYQVNLEIPASLSPGSYGLSLTEGDLDCRGIGRELDFFPLEVH
jgi:uncharacterized protein (TIGR03437 family)